MNFDDDREPGPLGKGIGCFIAVVLVIVTACGFVGAIGGW